MQRKVSIEGMNIDSALQRELEARLKAARHSKPRCSLAFLRPQVRLCVEQEVLSAREVEQCVARGDTREN